MEACGVFVSVLILGMLVSDTRCDGKVMVNATQSVHGMLRQVRMVHSYKPILALFNNKGT